MTTDPPDGLEWIVEKAAPIREDNLYGGVRLKLTARLGNMRIPAQVDVGFGDSITPEAKIAEWPMLLDFPSVPLLVYCPETSIAEKLHAAVELETANSRMKDFYDIHWLSLHPPLKESVLRKPLRLLSKGAELNAPPQLRSPSPIASMVCRKNRPSGDPFSTRANCQP